MTNQKEEKIVEKAMRSKTAFIFSGQGAQYPGMFADLAEAEPAAAGIFSMADKVLGRSISELCFNGTEDDLILTHNTQPCVLTADLAAAMTLRSHGIVPDAVAGFSLGEYAALAFAGALSPEETLRTVQLRADAMQEAVPAGEGGMAAVIGSSSDEVEQICEMVKDDYVILANYNSPVQSVISGTAAGVAKAAAIAEERGMHITVLDVSAPFHCRLMEPAAEKLKEHFRKITFTDTEMPVYMNVDAMPVTKADEIPDRLVRQASNPVRWADTIRKMHEDGIETFIECGPGKTLSRLAKKTVKGINVYRVEDLQTLKKTLEGLKI